MQPREGRHGRRRRLGPAHLDTLTTINNLALVLKAQGKLEVAEPLYREALDGCRKELGSTHAGTLTSLNNLARLLQDEGKLAEAEPLHVVGGEPERVLERVLLPREEMNILGG